MGASILPVAIKDGKLAFLFGKERDIDDTPGWSDFGGGTDNKESFIQTAVRESGEELTGFLGGDKDIKNLLEQYGTFHIDFKSDGHGVYRVHIFPFHYNPWLTHYYNNNQQFLQKRLDKKIIRDTKIFEKQRIDWFTFEQMAKKKKEFRSFYQNIVDLILVKKDEITKFIFSKLGKKNTRMRRRRNNRTRKYKI
jgi:NUDIX domain